MEKAKPFSISKREVWEAYKHVKANQGAAGVDGQSIAEFERDLTNNLSKLWNRLSSGSYFPPPVRRVDIPKGEGRTRPLGIPTVADRIAQTVVKRYLEPEVEKVFPPDSYGYRPGKSALEAVGQTRERCWRYYWVLDLDIQGFFDSLDHAVLWSILGESCHDRRFLRVIARLLQAGYLEAWRSHTTLSGVPQGGVVSPLLSHRSLDRLARFVETVRLPADHDGPRRRPYPPYMALLNGARNHRLAGNPRGAKALRRQAPRLPARAPSDPHLRRLGYVRYADDWLLGVSGPREEAETITGQLGEYWRETLHLTRSPTKTLNARTEAARVLGDEIVHQPADDQQYRALRRRCITGAPGLKVPVDSIRANCTHYRRRGNPIHLAARLHDRDYRLVAQYHAADRGLVQYYLRAYNVPRLWHVHRVMPRSLGKPLAHQHRMRGNRVDRKSRSTGPSPPGTLTVREVQHARGQGNKPLVARCGGLELRWPTPARLNDQPTAVFGARREVVQRLLAPVCERCGTRAKGEGHHLRKLADLSRPGRSAKALWGRRMAARRRQTLVVCPSCHADLHRERPSRRKVTAELTGARLEIERRMSRSAGGGGKSTSDGNSPAAYPTARAVLMGGGDGDTASLPDPPLRCGFRQQLKAGVDMTSDVKGVVEILVTFSASCVPLGYLGPWKRRSQ